MLCYTMRTYHHYKPKYKINENYKNKNVDIDQARTWSHTEVNFPQHRCSGDRTTEATSSHCG